MSLEINKNVVGENGVSAFPAWAQLRNGVKGRSIHNFKGYACAENQTTKTRGKPRSGPAM